MAMPASISAYVERERGFRAFSLALRGLAMGR
eukprot:SAG11_NODE_36471_length_261_cov_0.950617_1_plen_31_part_01